MQNHPQDPFDNIRPCSVCGDEANYFCRMCSLHYCPEHLCLHLSVAWEDNSWTKRNASESTDFNFGENNDKSLDNENGEVFSKSSEQLSAASDAAQNPIPANEKALTSYTGPQLQAQLNFYISQSRRIKRELERRLLPSEGFSFSGQNQLHASKRTKLAAGERRPRILSKSASRAASVLANAMRANGLTLEQIKAAIGSSDSAP